MSSSPDNINWSTLRRLRRTFLDGTGGDGDYWNSLDDLEHYDATFAQRIGWKWDFVLGELSALDWTPPEGNILDWGCGSGIAGRTVISHFGLCGNSTLWVSDRSTRAVQFASRKAADRFPNLTVNLGAPKVIDLLLVSHVLTEITASQIEQIVALAAQAQSVIWVEPGTYEASLTMIAIREQLRDRFNNIAPCTHQNRCGILSPENERHWCHFFARPPNEIFTDSFWSKFGHEMEIDLRSLPLSFLVLDKRTWPEQSLQHTRIIGRPNMFKPHAEVLACSCDGVSSLEVRKRTHPEAYREIKKGNCPSRAEVVSEGRKVVDWKAV